MSRQAKFVEEINECVMLPRQAVFYTQKFILVITVMYHVVENWSLDLRSWCLTLRTTRHIYHSFLLIQSGDALESAASFYITSSR